MKTKQKKWVFLLLIILNFTTTISKAQEDVRYWTSFNINAPLTKKVDVRFNYLRSIEEKNESWKTNFNWYLVRFNYAIDKNWDLQAGTAWMQLPGSETTTNRVFARVFKSSRINKKIVLRNGIHVEHHNKYETRFDQRIILISRLGLRKRLDFLKLSPSISYLLFYNIGGTPIRYYAPSGEQIAYQAANGFHRGRLLLNLNTKLNKQLRASIFYMHQHEFNIGSETRTINVLNPNTGRIQRPFNNYHTFGLSLSYLLSGNNKKPYLENIFTY